MSFSSFFTSLNVKINLPAFEQALQDYVGQDNLGSDNISQLVAAAKTTLGSITLPKKLEDFPDFVKGILALKTGVTHVVLIVEEIAKKIGDLTSPDKKELATDLLSKLVELPAPLSFFAEPVFAIAIGFVVDEINKLFSGKDWLFEKALAIIQAA